MTIVIYTHFNIKWENPKVLVQAWTMHQSKKLFCLVTTYCGLKHTLKLFHNIYQPYVFWTIVNLLLFFWEIVISYIFLLHFTISLRGFLFWPFSEAWGLFTQAKLLVKNSAISLLFLKVIMCIATQLLIVNTHIYSIFQ